MNGREDLYIILEIGRSASESDIKRAFRKLARRCHPDINPGDRSAEERFKRISEAYEVLSDPAKRKFYDENGFYTEGVLATSSSAEWGFSFEGLDFGKTGSSAMGEFFGQVFGRHTTLRHEPERGQDLEYQISLSFADSIRGIRTSISVLRKAPCPLCKASGRKLGAREMACGRCSGSGKAALSKGLLQFSMTCPDCGGSGVQFSHCPECNGEGRVARNEQVEVEIPAGVTTGGRVRFAAKGDSGRLGGQPGDLYVVTNVAPHPFFKRVGDNIHCTVPITIAEAALGTKVEVPTIDGPAVVRIPPATQNGQTFRLRDKGTPSLLDPRARGDQYVEVRVVIPRICDERSKEILREFSKLNPEDPRKEIWK
jgi:molecular chaperone DnaJ